MRETGSGSTGCNLPGVFTSRRTVDSCSVGRLLPPICLKFKGLTFSGRCDSEYGKFFGMTVGSFGYLCLSRACSGGPFCRPLCLVQCKGDARGKVGALLEFGRGALSPRKLRGTVGSLVRGETVRGVARRRSGLE